MVTIGPASGFSLSPLSRYISGDKRGQASLGERRRPPMCYTRKERDLEREARRVTESRLMEEEARHRQEQHERRVAERERPLTEKVKEMVGAR
jgi:hypothetical protein